MADSESGTKIFVVVQAVILNSPVIPGSDRPVIPGSSTRRVDDWGSIVSVSVCG